MVLYYSGTGNSRYVAEAIADRLSDQVVCANTYIKNGQAGGFESESPWVFVFPVYISAMAEIFYDFIRKSAFSGCRKAYFVATCASDMGTSPNIARELCALKKLEFMGTEKVVMPQNYIALFHMTEPEEIKTRQNNALLAADRISRTIQKGGSLDLSCRSTAYKILTETTVKLYNRFFTRTGSFYAADSCVGCGLCEKVCPLNNIRLVNRKPEWDKHCVHCMSCINQCPKAAIEYGKMTVSKPRYTCVKYKPSENLNADRQSPASKA